MINVLLIVPYPEMQSEVEHILANHELVTRRKIQVAINIVSQEDIRTLLPKPECDVLIARGFSAAHLRKEYENIPQVELPISVSDVIRGIKECMENRDARNIALIGTKIPKNDIELMNSIFPISITHYPVDDLQDIVVTIRKALAADCDILLGGATIRNLARFMRVPAVMIKTGIEAIEKALDDAFQLVTVMHMERERAEIVTTISNCSSDGIMYVGEDGTVRMANPAALKFLGSACQKMDTIKIDRVSPTLAHMAKEARLSRQGVQNYLYRHGKYMLSVSFHPVILGNNTPGVIFTMQDVTRIQQLETTIRKSLNKNGLEAKYQFKDIIYRSKKFEQLITLARRYSATSSNVLITGETGVGKELLAQSIHNESPRSKGPFVAVNCAAIPEHLLESELFGYEEGSFTGSSKGGKPGLFELAHTGTFFLDEISELPLNFQSKVLRVLQEREVRRVGAGKVTAVDVRIISASNVNLKKQVEEKRFRRDLLYRLDVLHLHVPNLWERPEDIEPIFLHYIGAFNVEGGAMDMLRAHTFEGNIRELQNIAERLSIMCLESQVITPADMRLALESYDEEKGSEETRSQTQTLKGALHVNEREQIFAVLERCGFNQTRAARELGIDRTTLWRKIRKHS
ncbi:MAG: sigma 54-interacting transcriptional regulator [Treponema sp.]|nr:sigma 54-interacting transcriptional regulator [Treponema sp.]